jgi:hypothetical protein
MTAPSWTTSSSFRGIQNGLYVQGQKSLNSNGILNASQEFAMLAVNLAGQSVYLPIGALASYYFFLSNGVGGLGSGTVVFPIPGVARIVLGSAEVAALGSLTIVAVDSGGVVLATVYESVVNAAELGAGYAVME